MIKKMVDRWVDTMIKNGADEKKRQIYAYGLECTANEIASDILLLSCAVISGRVWEMVVWIIVFNLLRVNVGGFHASTPMRCIVGSTLLGIACTNLYPYLIGRKVLENVLSVLCICIVIIISPVLNMRHPVMEHRRQIARKRAIFLTILIAGTSAFVQNRSLSAIMSVSMYSVILFAAVAYIQNRRGT